MPDLTTHPTGGPDGALGWYRESLAKVLGLNPGDPSLAADQLGELATDAQRRALLKVVSTRFLRTVDAETGAVTIDQVGDPLVLMENDDEVDAVLAGIAGNYLAAAGNAIGSIDVGQCIPGACPDQAAGIATQIKSTLATLAAEAPRRRNTFQTFLHLDELTNVNYGLLYKLNKLFSSKAALGVRSVERERAQSAVRVAQRALTCFEEAIRETIACDDEPTLGEVVDIVRKCGPHIAGHVQNLRRQLRRASIGDCEIQSLQLPLDRCIPLSGENFEAVTFDQALQTIETESARWRQLLAGGPEGFTAVSSSAEALTTIVGAIQSDAILKKLGILPDGEASEPRQAYAADLALGIERMCAYVQLVLTRIIDVAPAVAPARRRRAAVKPAQPDNYPMA